MTFTIGSNVLSAAMVVVVFSIFAVAIAQTYRNYANACDSSELFGMTLELAEQTRDHILENMSPLDEFVGEKREILNKSGSDFKLEIRDFHGKTVFSHGQNPDPVTEYFSPRVGVYLPVSFNSEPCELSISLWRV